MREQFETKAAELEAKGQEAKQAGKLKRANVYFRAAAAYRRMAESYPSDQ